MWRRAAWAVLTCMGNAVFIGCIVSLCWLKPYEAFAGNIAFDPHSKTELGAVQYVAKNIMIFCPSPNQQWHVIAAEQVDTGDGDRRWVHALIWTDEPAKCLSIRLILEIERFKRLLTQVKNSVANPRDESSCSCRAGIFPRDKDSPFAVDVETTQIYRIQENISPQLTLASVFGPLNEIISRSPQLPSSDAEYASRESEDHGPNSDNAFGIEPFKAATPRKRAPFFPVFGLGTLTFLASMLGGIYIYRRGDWPLRHPKRKWRGRLLKGAALILFALGSFSFVFGFPWAALF